MKVSSFIHTLLVASVCFVPSLEALSHGVGKHCGAIAPDLSKIDAAMARTIADCTTTLTNISNEYWPEGVTLIMPVWFHIIHKTDGTGNISDDTVYQQMQVLNEDYAAKVGTMGASGYNTRIQFELKGITRTENDAWFINDTESEYKPALAVDVTKYINIYTTTAQGLLGYAYFPQSNAGILDGIVLLHEAVGGRDNAYIPYDQGRTLVHEMGHYLGLFHTFQVRYDTCENSYSLGDLIIDTPSELEAHYDCNQTTSCGTDDPIHNYMNYTPDSCMTEFTPEQANRAVCSVINYRTDTYRLVDNTGKNITPIIVPYLLDNSSN